VTEVLYLSLVRGLHFETYVLDRRVNLHLHPADTCDTADQQRSLPGLCFNHGANAHLATGRLTVRRERRYIPPSMTHMIHGLVRVRLLTVTNFRLVERQRGMRLRCLWLAQSVPSVAAGRRYNVIAVVAASHAKLHSPAFAEEVEAGRRPVNANVSRRASQTSRDRSSSSTARVVAIFQSLLPFVVGGVVALNIK
jgi:hypothetical protein